MRPLTAIAFLLLALSGPLQAGQIEAPVGGDFTPGSQNGSLGAGLNAPVPLQLAVPSLTAATSPGLATALNSAPAPTANLAAPRALAAVPELPASVIPEPVAAEAVRAKGPAAPAAVAGETKSAPFAPDASPESGVAAGRLRFDQAAAAEPEVAAPRSLWTQVRDFVPIGDRVPAWPGSKDERVRIAKIKAVLDRRVGDGGTSTVWQSRDRQYAIKILKAEALSSPAAREEVATLRALAGTDVPVARILAESRDHTVIVKEFIEGKNAAELLAAGPLQKHQVEGWAEFVAVLLRRGITADFARNNLIWQHWRSRWVIADAAGLKDGGPKSVLDQLLSAEFVKAAGIDAPGFLSGLRARLGPDSAKWAEAAAALRPELRAALARYDAALPAAPKIAFGPAPKASGGLDDSVVSPKELVKRLGFDPHATKVKIKLHGEDPGKLNTVILSIQEPGKPAFVMKTAQWYIIRNEAAGRRLARRFFGRYFRVPASLSVENGLDSYMIMERADAEPSYYANPFKLEQRVAAALFLRTFGISDVNQGNVLVPSDGGLPWLIDFEQAFGRSDPSTGKHIPDERIALEKPWMSLQTRNRIEDYQPAIRAWRAEMAKPENQRAIEADLLASGFTKPEAAYLLATFNANAADLDWTLQNDADFVNQFVARNAVQR